MSGEARSPDNPAEWLSRARSNLALARQRIPDAYLEDLCFEAQQAAEKAIKGVLIKRGIAFPYVHDLARLLTLLDTAGEPMPGSVAQAEALSQYAFVSRYPGPSEPVTEADYLKALALAQIVVQWAEERIG